ncbi:carbohydrate ABC transporter permease [Paenibacillus nasutitermitis]|uniref:ABC transporter permease n=1 Tax=Paenibacillus nasutitermitis TaxID=1652958 RepID=A0A917E2L6_9BACL|nr:carbohydrate ABC transporter permease [Paenibacillus nasutitermitis]GGD93928.1 ABC transporter permease [Paenibacillus nasutitermitis]
MKRVLHRKIILLVGIALISVIVALPFVMMILSSFKTMAEIQSPVFRILPESFSFDNYWEAMRQGNWARYFSNSFIITAITVSLGLLTMSLAGYAFARLNFKGRDLLFFFSLIGLMIPEQVILVPVFLKIKEFPLVGGNDLWGNGGIGFLNSYWGLIIPQIAHPFGVFLFRQFFLQFPKALDEAAKIDGCSRLRTLLKIYVPASLPVFATLALLKSIGSWNQYTWPLVISNADNMRTVQLALSIFKTEYAVQWNYILAATTLIALPVLLLFLLLQKYYVQGIVTSGVKG